ncbi:MAG: DNA/RNA non-specific endonuclease [Campylobacterota bacterium]|nr:DNA/RNA non-specific endonuclease [Campylobacterota bacterium]
MNRYLLYSKSYSIVFSSAILLLLSSCGSNHPSVTSTTQCDIKIDKRYYEICYDYTLKGARSLSYSLDAQNIERLNIEDRPSFYQERLLPEKYRSSYDDYIGTDYDRGHLASDASFDWSESSLKSVYSMANIVPQHSELNRYSWVDTENLEREKAQEYGTVEVYIEVDYSDNPMQIGENFISVPSGFYKNISNKNYGYEECFYYENIPYDISTDTIDNHKVLCRNVD